MRVFFCGLYLLGFEYLMKKRVACYLSLFFLHIGNLYADEINIAVASNFTYTLRSLAADFKVNTGHEVRISNASSGKLFAQIQHGAPYDIFLSADEKRPDLLIKEHKASVEGAYVYALGKLIMLSNIQDADNCRNVLFSKQLNRLAIANPKIAPYGMAARQVLEKLDLWQQLQSRVVMGENITQTLQFVSTKNAEAGFVAKSILNMGKAIDYACVWEIPGDMYTPIKQKMVLLNAAKDKPAAQAFMLYMQSVEAKRIIRSAGYDIQ